MKLTPVQVYFSSHRAHSANEQTQGGNELSQDRLTWGQVNAWRLSQHGLSARLGRQDFLKAATCACGIHAQVMSAAELSLWARVDGLSPQDVRDALWQERTLVKTWAMRGTLHLIPAADLPLYAAARSVYPGRNWLGYYTYFGVTPAQVETFFTAIPQVLGAEPMTREELAVAVAEQTGISKLREVVMESSWGSPLKPPALRGDLCFGPAQGRSVTFVRPSAWTGKWQAVEPLPALHEITRRYLRAFGPSTPQDFALWWEMGIVNAKKLFTSMDEELVAVEIEGRPAFALRSMLEPLQEAHVSGLVDLLPLFDAYLLGIGRDREPILPSAYKSQVFRPQGWISAVVLVDGYIRGVWEYKARRAQTTVTVQLFSPPTTSIRQGIEAEAERLGVFLNIPVVVEYESA